LIFFYYFTRFVVIKEKIKKNEESMVSLYRQNLAHFIIQELKGYNNEKIMNFHLNAPENRNSVTRTNEL